MRQRLRHPAGFTLMELLIAVSLTALMLLLFNQVFDSTRQLISQGTARGDAIANSSGIDSTMRQDADNMVGPHDNTTGMTPRQSGGVLIITQVMLPARLDAPQNRFIIRPVRSDQLVFISKRQPGQTSISPESDAQFASPNDDGIAKYVRVWYGHALRTNADGSDPTGSAIDVPADPNFPGVRPGLNADANRWILGRQALMLGEAVDGTLFNLPDDSDTLAGPADRNAWAHAQGAFLDADVVGLGVPAAVDSKLWMGLTDYAYSSLDDPLAYLTVGPAFHPWGAVVGDASAAGMNSTGFRLWSSAADYSGGDTYNLRAIREYTFAAKRLRVNPVPHAAGNLAAWQTAQIHPYMMEYVSDFAVDFAADMDLDGDVDTLPANTTVTDVRGVNHVYPQGSTIWYTAPDYANDGTTNGSYRPNEPLTFPVDAGYGPYEDFTALGGSPYGNTHIGFVWRHDDEGDPMTLDAQNRPIGIETTTGVQPSFWPYMLRIRFKLHDARGQLQAGGVAQWQNDDIDNDWDGFVDEQNGIHDGGALPAARAEDTEVDNGIWFEQIIPVNRPPVPAP